MARDFKTVIELANERDAKVVVEIGSMRQAVDHGDGHSTIYWQCFDEVYSYDIEPAYTELTKIFCKNVTAETKDGVLALKEFPKKIDVLYLDAWDVGTPGYMHEHLKAFQAAEDKLHSKSIVLIDDMHTPTEGKGALIVPYAKEKGWRVLHTGYQVILLK